MRRFGKLATLTLAVPLFLPVAGYAASDNASGLAVNPPENFRVEKSSHRRHDVAFAIFAKNGKPVAANRDGSLCKVAYKSAPQNARVSREQINSLTVTKDRQNMVRRILGRVFEIGSLQVIDHQGYKALEIHATPKVGPDAANVRLFLAMIETVKGRTSLTCATRKSAFPAALKDFRAIRATVNAPR